MHTYSATPGRRCRDRRGFTIIEATITIGIIALLSAIVIYAVGKVRGQGDIIAERAMVTTLQKAVERFKQEFNFLPPLVVDTGAGPAPANLTGPISGTQIVVWDVKNLADDSTTLNGSTGIGAMTGDRKCYSTHSLAYYLAGALDVSYDGGAGLTFTAPQSDGQFSKHGRAHEAMVDLTQQKTRLGATRLYISANTGGTTPLQRSDCRIWDRWSVGTPGGASYEIRYYRWLPSFYRPDNVKAGQVEYWNVPVIIGGNPDNRLPPLKAELRTAEYAIISAGPDHVFGTADDIMEVGR